AISSRLATTVGASKAAVIIKQPALAPSPQPRPAPTARALPPKLVDQRGPFWVPIRGPIPTPIDIHISEGRQHRVGRVRAVADDLPAKAGTYLSKGVWFGVSKHNNVIR